MKIKIDSLIPCNLFLHGNQYQTPVELTLNDTGRVLISVLPAYPERYGSYTLIITTDNGKMVDLSGGAKAICWGEFVEINLTPPSVVAHFSPKPISQKRLSRDLITLYDDGRVKLMMEGTSFFNFDLPENLTDVTLKAKDTTDGAIASVKGRLDDKEYLLALYSNSNEWKVMHELIGDKIEITDTGVKVESIIPSMLRYEKKEFYKAYDPNPVEYSYTPTIRHTYPSELIPYLFLEDVILKNENCLTYLDANLGLDMGGLIEFFDGIDCVVFPECFDYGLEVVATYNSNDRITYPDLYKFVVENDKIVNIIHLLTCH